MPPRARRPPARPAANVRWKGDMTQSHPGEAGPEVLAEMPSVYDQLAGHDDVPVSQLLEMPSGDGPVSQLPEGHPLRIDLP